MDITPADAPGDGPPQFHFRLVGTALDTQLGRNLTGKPVEPVPPERRIGTLYGAYLHCFEAARPNYQFWELDMGDRAKGTFERLVLPLCTDGTQVDMLIGCAYYENLASLKEL